MIRINLLPTTITRPVPSIRNQLIAAGVAVFLSLGGVLFLPLWDFGYFPVTKKIKKLDSDIAKAEQELKKVQAAQKLLAEIKENNRKIEEKINIIKEIENKRTGPVWVMDELTDAVSRFCVTDPASNIGTWKYIDDKIFIQKMSIGGEEIQLEGIALNNTYLVAFLNNLKYKNKLFSDVVLYFSDQAEFEGAMVRKFKISARVNLTAKPEEGVRQEPEGQSAPPPGTCSLGMSSEPAMVTPPAPLAPAQGSPTAPNQPTQPKKPE